MFVIEWQFQVRPGHERRFEEIYGPEGAWAQLFRQDSGYIRTELQRDPNHPRRYQTRDFWQSREAYEAFRREYRAQYEALDAQCEELTEHELEIGRSANAQDLTPAESQKMKSER